MSWSTYMQGQEGRWRFRAERLRLPNGLSLVAGLALDPWQREVWDLFDDPTLRLGYLDASRGTGKTTLAAALAVERLVLRRGHDVIVLANDRDQARLLFREADGVVQQPITKPLTSKSLGDSDIRKLIPRPVERFDNIHTDDFAAKLRDPNEFLVEITSDARFIRVSFQEQFPRHFVGIRFVYLSLSRFESFYQCSVPGSPLIGPRSLRVIQPP